MNEGTQIKRLYRTEADRVVAGVCGGVAVYLNIDPTIIRVIWLAAILFAGTGVLLYLVGWVIIPTESVVKNVQQTDHSDQQKSK